MDLRFLKRFTDGITPPVCPEILEVDPLLTNISWLPLHIPKIEPDNWDLFWELWNREKSPMGKEDNPYIIWDTVGIWSSPDTGNSAVHEDFPYKMEDWSSYFPIMFERIRTAMPFLRINNIRISSNIKRVNPHLDPTPTMYPWPNSLRVMLWDSNPIPTFYMLPWPESSFLQKPIPKIDVIPNQTYILGDVSQQEKIYVDLPVDTNTFIFSNGEFLHGADLASPKIILIVHGVPDAEKWKSKLYGMVNIK